MLLQSRVITAQGKRVTVLMGQYCTNACHGRSRLATPTQVHSCNCISICHRLCYYEYICIVAFFVYFGSLTVKLLAHAPHAEMGEFIDNIIFLFGTLALILLLPILVRAFGLFALLVWTIYLVRDVATKKSHKSVLGHVFNKIKEQINGPLVDAGEPILS